MNTLFADGGVILKNPSPVGGTWAYRHVADNDDVINEFAAVITLAEAKVKAVTNNQTEMLAVINGLAILPDNWIGTVCSDSKITLGRLFWGWRWSEIPLWLIEEHDRQRARLVHFEKFQVLLVDGHPTKAQLAAGIGKRGNPVSEHNVWCDHACRTAAKEAGL